jgi:DNA repair protein RadD
MLLYLKNGARASAQPHARNLQTQFLAAGIRCEYIDAFTAAAVRNDIGDRFNAGELDVVCNVGCLTTGIDWDVRCIILARPTKSEMLFVQMIGRGLRTAPGKTDCLILDHSDNHTRLGFVDDIHYDDLDDGEPRKVKNYLQRPLPKKCPQCSFLKPAKVSTCPVCSFTPKPVCTVVAEDGDLVEFAAREAEISTQEKRFFYAELRRIADERGYKKGWSAAKFKDKFGSFPSWAWNDDQTATPAVTTLGWVKSRQIAYARATRFAS